MKIHYLSRTLLAASAVFAGLLISSVTARADVFEPAATATPTPTPVPTGIVSVDGNKYFYGSKGKKVSGWQTVGDNTYYFIPKAAKNAPKYSAAKGFKKIDGKKYYFSKGGKLCKGWKSVKGYRYMLSDKGEVLTSWQKLDGKTYYFDSEGRMTTGFKTIDGEKYYFSGSNGKNKTRGAMFTGLLKLKNKYYYMSPSSDKTHKAGAMVTNERYLSGKHLYYFGSNGYATRVVDGTKPMVALTYDDGPSKNTATILDSLKKENQVATFFVVGCRVKEFKSMILRENAQGCEIASHTYNHQILTRCGAEKLKTEMEDTDKVLTEVLGFGSTIMRPPGGAVNDSVKENMEKPMIIWSVDTRDWATRNAESTKKAVLDNIKDGDIVLMHDLYEATAKASQDIIPALVKKGYQLVTVSELAELRGKKLENGKTYFSIR